MGEERRPDPDATTKAGRADSPRVAGEMATAPTMEGVAVSSPPDPLLGQVLAERYRLERRLGEGGMGVVYRAEHVVIGKKVALKILASDFTRRDEVVTRFLQEARSASRIGHENVIDVTDFGHTPGESVFLVMELLEGEDLGQLVRRIGPLPWSRAKPILIQVCRALRAAHSRGVIHRDIKPENVFLTNREGRPDFVKVLDFGIAHLGGLDESGPRLTKTGVIFGTPEYMSPEQAEGRAVDQRSDVYAVGCLAFYLVTGATPFTSDSFMGMLTKHMHEAPTRPSERRPELIIPKEVDALILNALEKVPGRRCPDMETLARAIAAAGAPTSLPLDANELPLAAPNPLVTENRTAALDQISGPRPIAPRARGNRRGLIVAGAAIGIASAVAAGVLTRSGPAPTPTPTPAPASHRAVSGQDAGGAPEARAVEAPIPPAAAVQPSRAATRPSGVRNPAARPRTTSPAQATPVELKNPFQP